MAILTPAFIDDMSWAMAEVYGAVTDQILINLAHYFPYFDENKLPASSFAYQADMLAQMGQVNRETTAIIRRALGDADDTLKKVLNQAIMHSVGSVNNALWGAVVDGIFSAPKVPVLAPNQMQAFKLYYQQAAQRLNLVNTVMLESTKQAYQATVADIAYRVHIAQSALNIAAGEAVTGVSTWNTAAKHAMDRLKDDGIVGFIDHGGHRWSAEAYTAMDIRTTVANTARAAVWETNESFGNDLYVVSYHNGARPGCYPWQNKVISSTDNARTVTDLDGNEIQVIAQSDTSYGQAAGLFGVNCKHYPSPFIPGVSLIRGEPQDEKANAKAYAESQEQRRLERRVREEKRDLLMEKARGAPQSVIDAQRERVRAAQADVQDFCVSTGRARHKDREGVYTKREFPDKNTYDVTTFTREQKELYDDYWQNGGAQQGRTFGQMGGAQQAQSNGEIDYDAEIARLEAKKAEYMRTHNRFNRDPEEMRLMQAEIQNLELGKLAAQQKAQLAAEQARQAAKVAQEQQTRAKWIAQYDDEIAKLRAKRQALFDAGTHSKAETDKLLADIMRLEDEKKIVEGGGYTMRQATVTRKILDTARGTASNIEFEADIYTMPDGMSFALKQGINKAHQTLTPEQLVNSYYKTPKELREKSGINIIHVVDRYNPNDAYWRKTYKNFTKSYMTGGKTITIYRHDYEHDMDYMLESLRHEMGHGVDSQNGWFSDGQEWADARAADKAFSGGVAESVSDYGKNSNHEDFAESVMKYTGSPTAFTAAFPNRAKILERLVGVLK